MKKESQNLADAKKCVDSLVAGWNKTNLTDIEKWSIEELMIWGVLHLALYMLNLNDYNELKEYIWTEYGYNPGGTSGDYEKGVIK